MIRVLMLCEYFFPYDTGGSEWSTYYLARDLLKKSIVSTVLTPNYGNSRTREYKDKVEVIRFPFYKKLRGKNQLTPYWHTNTLWYLTSSIFTLYFAITAKADVIPVQGKYFLPAAILTKFLTGKKVIFTERDYIILCPLGICLIKSGKPCDFNSLLKSDLPLYIRNYMPKASKLRVLMQIIFTVRAKFKSEILKQTLKLVDKKVTSSKISKDLYQKAGVKDMTVIPNSYEIKRGKKTLKIRSKNPVIMYAGRLTYGKGIQILFEAMPAVLGEYPNAVLKVAGNGFLKNDLLSFAKKHNFEKSVEFLGHQDHKKLLNYVSLATCTVMPSVWPEPFGRVALESIASGTPVVASEKAGISQQLSSRWAIVTSPDKTTIASAIISSIKNNALLRKNIYEDWAKIKKIWSTDVTDAHVKIYQYLIK